MPIFLAFYQTMIFYTDYESLDIPYYHIRTDNISREEHEAKIINILRQLDLVDYIVLA